MRTLILLLYYERPVMVQNALRSVLKANEHHDDWELAFIDDSSPTPGRPICEEILKDHLDKVRFYHTEMTPEEKIETSGMVGGSMNQALDDSDAELAIMLCDDDELHPEYLSNLGKWFSTHEDNACYSHVIAYNPIFESSEFAPMVDSELNHTGYITPFMNLDASQVAWRTSISARFSYHRTKFLDGSFYNQLPDVPFSGFVSQFKGVHATQLGHWDCSKVWNGNTIDTPDGELLTPVEVIHGIIDKYLDLGMKEPARLICEKAIGLHPEHTDFYLLLGKSCED